MHSWCKHELTNHLSMYKIINLITLAILYPYNIRSYTVYHALYMKMGYINKLYTFVFAMEPFPPSRSDKNIRKTPHIVPFMDSTAFSISTIYNISMDHFMFLLLSELIVYIHTYIYTTYIKYMQLDDI